MWPVMIQVTCMIHHKSQADPHPTTSRTAITAPMVVDMPASVESKSAWRSSSRSMREGCPRGQWRCQKFHFFTGPFSLTPIPPTYLALATGELHSQWEALR